MAIKLKVTNEKGEVREITVKAGETLELQAGEKIEIVSASTENLDLAMDGGDLALSLGGVQITIGNFYGSGGLDAGGQTISAQQVASGLFTTKENTDNQEESGNQEEIDNQIEAENTESPGTPDTQIVQSNLNQSSSQQSDIEIFSTLAESDPLEDTFTSIQQATTNDNANFDREDPSGVSNDNNDTPPDTPPVFPLELTTPILLVATEEELFSFTIPEATGGYNNNIYSVLLSNGQALPDWLSFDASTRTLSGTPDDGDLESLDLQITVSDITGSLSPVVNTIELNVSGVNDAPELTLDQNGDLQSINIADIDAGATITKATITLQNGEAGDVLSVDLGDSGLTSSYVDGVLTISGNASADVYQAILQNLAHSSSGNFTVGGERLLGIVVTDDQGADSNSATASDRRRSQRLVIHRRCFGQ